MSNLKNRDIFIKAYKTYIIESNAKPSSIANFCLSVKKKESDFYACFANFEDLESAILLGMLGKDIETSTNSVEFASYSTRERLLSLFYTHFATLSNYRSFILLLKDLNKFQFASNFTNLKKYHDLFTEGIEQILKEKNEADEIPDRMFVSNKYKELIWTNFMFVFNFWLNDNSPEFEKTDACIEKSINLSVDLMQENLFDHAFDFGKFVIQNIVKR